MLIIRILTFDESHINLQCNSASLSNLSSSSSVQLIQLSYLVAVRCFCISNVFERWSYPDDCCLEYFSQQKNTKFLSLFIKIFYSLHFCSVIHILLNSSRLYMYLRRPVVHKVYSIWFGPFRSYNFHIVYVGTSTRPKKTLCSLIPARVIPVAIAGVADKMTKNSIRIFTNRGIFVPRESRMSPSIGEMRSPGTHKTMWINPSVEYNENFTDRFHYFWICERICVYQENNSSARRFLRSISFNKIFTAERCIS